jgi:hypothetical protein
MGGSGVVTGAMKLTSLSWISYRIFRPCDLPHRSLSVVPPTLLSLSTRTQAEQR